MQNLTKTIIREENLHVDIMRHRAVFTRVSWNQNKRNQSGQSQQTQTIQWTNHNSKQLDVTGAKRGKTRANNAEQVAIGFGFTSDWLRKWREIL